MDIAALLNPAQDSATMNNGPPSISRDEPSIAAVPQGPGEGLLQECPKCRDGNYNKEDLARHLKTMHNITQTFCNIAGCLRAVTGFNRIDSLRHHMKKHHPEHSHPLLPELKQKRDVSTDNEAENQPVARQGSVRRIAGRPSAEAKILCLDLEVRAKKEWIAELERRNEALLALRAREQEQHARDMKAQQERYEEMMRLQATKYEEREANLWAVIHKSM